MSPARNRRSYDQYCGVARALDVLGERWTLLIIRDLLPGPRRYGQLAEHLPGIGTDLLTARLRLLEENGLVERESVGGVGGGITYRLTDAGEQLRPLIAELARVGLRWIEEPAESTAHRDVVWALLTVSMYLSADEVPAEPIGITGTNDHLVLERDGHGVAVAYTDRPHAGVSLSGDDDSLLAVLSGHLELPAAAVTVHGNRRVAQAWIHAIRKRLPAPLAAPQVPRTRQRIERSVR